MPFSLQSGWLILMIIYIYIYINIRGEKVHLTLGTKCLFEKKKPKPYSINEEGDLNTGFPLFLIKEIRQCH